MADDVSNFVFQVIVLKNKVDDVLGPVKRVLDTVEQVFNWGTLAIKVSEEGDEAMVLDEFKPTLKKMRHTVRRLQRIEKKGLPMPPSVVHNLSDLRAQPLYVSIVWQDQYETSVRRLDALRMNGWLLLLSVNKLQKVAEAKRKLAKYLLNNFNLLRAGIIAAGVFKGLNSVSDSGFREQLTLQKAYGGWGELAQECDKAAVKLRHDLRELRHRRQREAGWATRLKRRSRILAGQRVPVQRRPKAGPVSAGRR